MVVIGLWNSKAAKRRVHVLAFDVRCRRPEPSSAIPQPSCASVLSRSRCCTALLAGDSLPRDLDILASWRTDARAASFASPSIGKAPVKAMVPGSGARAWGLRGRASEANDPQVH